MAKKRSQKLEEDISDLFRKEFGNVDIYRVEVTPGEDWDGDPILRITVVLDQPERLDPDQLGRFIRHIRDKLPKLETAFPLVGFRSTDDDKDLKAAAA